MNGRNPKSVLAEHRPPGAPARETEALAGIARRWREELARVLTETGAEALALDADELTDLAVAMTELAEDLHTDSGLWRGLEAGNRTLFGTPLPLIWRTDDSPLAPFDARRFQFFLHSVWRHFKPDRNHVARPPGLCRRREPCRGVFLRGVCQPLPRVVRRCISRDVERPGLGGQAQARLARDARLSVSFRVCELPGGDTVGLEYLLRRFKGFYYRRRYPNISLLGVA